MYQVIDPLGRATTYSAYDGYGRAIEVVDANDITTEIGYDWQGRVASRIYDSNGIGYETTNAYGVENLKATTMPNGSVVEYEYDALGRQRVMRRRAGAGLPVIESQEIVYTEGGGQYATTTNLYEGEVGGIPKRVSTVIRKVEADIYNGNANRSVTISVEGDSVYPPANPAAATVSKEYRDEAGNVVTRVLYLPEENGNTQRQVSINQYDILDRLTNTTTWLYVNDTQTT